MRRRYRIGPRHPHVNMDPFWNPNDEELRRNLDDAMEFYYYLMDLLECDADGNIADCAVDEEGGNTADATSCKDNTEDNNINIEDKIEDYELDFPPLEAKRKVNYKNGEDDDWDQLLDLATIISSTKMGCISSSPSRLLDHGIPFPKPVTDSPVTQTQKQKKGGISLGDDVKLALESAELAQNYELYKARTYITPWRRKQGQGKTSRKDIAIKKKRTGGFSGAIRSAGRSARVHGNAYPTQRASAVRSTNLHYY